MTCPSEHPLWNLAGPGFVDGIEVLGGHATDTCVRCRLCGRVFWTVCDMGKYQYMAEREIDPALAQRAAVEHDPGALAQLFVSTGLPHGPLWELTGALVEIFRELTPRANDAERARALREAGGAGGRWTQAIRVLETAARGASRSVGEAHFPVDVRLGGRTFREWHEVGDALVLLTEQSEMLRLEARGVTRLEVAAVPSFLAAGEAGLMLAVGDGGFLVVDAAGQVSTWEAKGPATAACLDGGWWLRVPDTGEPERVIELRKPDGRPCVGFKRHFAPGQRWMPSPRRMGDGWILSNLIDVDGATQVLSLVDASFKLVAQSGPCPAGDRRVTPIDSVTFLAEVDGGTERWARRGASLEIVETLVARSSWWIGERLITDGLDGRVTARGPDGVVQWTWTREVRGASYGVPSPRGLLVHDFERAHWLDLDGRLRRSFEVEGPDVRIGREGTVYVKSLVDLWILSGDDVHLLAVDTGMALESTCGDDAVLRDERGGCLLVDRSGRSTRFDAKDAHFPVYGTRGGPWVVEGDRVRGAFAERA
jgi:hypothetical protein